MNSEFLGKMIKWGGILEMGMGGIELNVIVEG